MTLDFFFKSLRRDVRGARGRALFFTACLAVGVAAVVGVAALGGAIQDGMRSQSRRLLAADLVVDSRRPLPPELAEVLANEPGLVRADVRETATMARGRDGISRICELKVVDGPYPLYGEVRLAPAIALADVMARDEVAVAPGLLETLGLAVGDRIGIGDVEFRIAAEVVEEPDRLDFSMVLGPRVFLSAAGLERSGLLGVGNRVRYRALLRVPARPGRSSLENLVDDLKERLPGAEYLRFETHWQSQPTVRSALERVENFLGLVALLSLLLGGIGVAQIVRTWIAARAESIAIQRCLGLRPGEVMILYLGQVVLLALVGSAVGVLVGASAPLLVVNFATELLPPELVRVFQPEAMLRGFALGVGVALVFALPPLTAVWRVPPSRVFRNDAEPLPAPRAVRFGALLLVAIGVFGAAWWQSGELRLAGAFGGGLALVAGLLAAAARGLAGGAQRLPRRGLSPYLVHGLAALGRPGASSTGALVSLGLGVLVVVAMALIEDRLDERLTNALPEDAPSVFLLDVQPEQWEGVRALMDEMGAQAVDSQPVVTARLAAIDGVPVREIAEGRAAEAGRGPGNRNRWSLTREQRLTFGAELPASNRLVKGALWTDPDRAEISVEEGFARSLDVDLGSTITFDVQGIPIEFTVTSLREVEWESFAINFFLLAEPGTLDAAPGYRLAVGRFPPERESEFQDRLAQRFPNVTVLRVREIIEKVVGLLRRLAFGVRALGAFTVLAGLAILAGSIASTTLRRGRETALLKTLGVTRAGVLGLMATEYGLVGAAAGLIGGVGAFFLAWLFLDRVLKIVPDLPWWQLPLVVLGAAAITVMAGLVASARALTVRPIALLRD